MIVRNDQRATLLGDFVVGHEYEVVVRAVGPDGVKEPMENAARNVIIITGKVTTPDTPTDASAGGFLNSIVVAWVNPANYDLKWVEVWRADTNDIATATKIAEVKGLSYTDQLGDGDLKRYYWLRAVNTSGQISDFTASVEATSESVAATSIDDFSITATKMFLNTIILDADVWTDDDPNTNSVSWNAHSIVYQGAAYPIDAGNTSAKYIYWVAGEDHYSTSATHPVLGNTGFMIATNTGGVHTMVWNSAANMVIGTAYIADLAVTDAKINTLSANKLTAGTIDASVIAVTNLNASNISSGTLGDARIGSATAWNAKLGVGDVGDMAFEDLVEAAKLGTTVISGGYIITSLLSADNIQAGTLTGRTVQTASSGQRIIMSGADNTLRFRDSSDNEVIRIMGAGTGYIRINTAGEVGMDLIGGGAVSGQAPLRITNSQANTDTAHVLDLYGYPTAAHPGQALVAYIESNGDIVTVGGISLSAGKLVDTIDVSAHRHSGAAGDGSKVYYTDLQNIPASFSPASHALLTHTVSGLTGGHFLKAINADQFGFSAHGLTYTDVGAAPATKGVTNGDSHNHSGGDGGTIAFSSIGSQPTTLSGYGITDAASDTELSTHTSSTGNGAHVPSVGSSGQYLNNYGAFTTITWSQISKGTVFSGTRTWVDPNTADVHTVVVSNGLITSWTAE